jgi:hypothetical protein
MVMSETRANNKGPFRGREKRHFFFLNPYEDVAFTRCPQCERVTKVRRFCLFIHVAPHHLLSFNKTCRYCPVCDLIIVKKVDLEHYLVLTFEQQAPDVIGNDYLVMGTLDRQLHHRGKKGELLQQSAIDAFFPFLDHRQFEVERGGWAPASGNE